MADKTISELIAASQVTPTDLFVLEQNATAKKLTGQTLENWLLSFADGHGGIQNIAKTSSSGTNPVVDTYTITFSDTSTKTFTVTNGVKGDTGARTYVWIKYSSVRPTKNSDMYDTPDDWIGIYTGTASTAPTSYTSYTWFKIKGETGATGEAAIIDTISVTYQASSSGTVVPSGTWSQSPPTLQGGQYLWTKTQLRYKAGDNVISYSVGYKGNDGTGAGDMTKSVYDPTNEVENAGGIVAYVGEHTQSVMPYDVNPKPNGIPTPGTSAQYARGDHVHITDTTRASKDMTNVTAASIEASLLAKGAIPYKTSITLGTSWNGSTSPFTQQFLISGYTVSQNTKIDLQPDATVIAQLAADKVLGMYVVNNGGNFYAYAVGKAPTVPLTIQITAEEVR